MNSQQKFNRAHINTSWITKTLNDRWCKEASKTLRFEIKGKKRRFTFYISNICDFTFLSSNLTLEVYQWDSLNNEQISNRYKLIAMEVENLKQFPITIKETKEKVYIEQLLKDGLSLVQFSEQELDELREERKKLCEESFKTLPIYNYRSLTDV